MYSRRVYSAAGAAAGTDAENTQSMTTLIPSTSVAATSTGVGYVEFYCVVTTLTAGTFAFAWAQNTADPLAAVTVVAGSYLEWAVS